MKYLFFSHTLNSQFYTYLGIDKLSTFVTVQWGHVQTGNDRGNGLWVWNRREIE